MAKLRTHEACLHGKKSPERTFQSLELLNRFKALCLGLPVPLWKNKRVPWGYIQDPDNANMCIADEKALKMLYRCRKLLEDYSYVDLAQWLTNGGYPISPHGVFKLLSERYPFKEIELPLEERLKL